MPFFVLYSRLANDDEKKTERDQELVVILRTTKNCLRCDTQPLPFLLLSLEDHVWTLQQNCLEGEQSRGQ